MKSKKFQELLREHKRLFNTSSSFSVILENIVSKVSLETGISKKDVHLIVSAQFRMINDVIYSGSEKTGYKDLNFNSYKSIRLIYLGAFMPSKNKYNKLVNFLKKKEKKKDV